MGHDPDTVPVEARRSQRIALLEAARSASPEARRMVDDALEDEDPALRRSALGALATQGRLEAGAILTGLDDPVALVRQRAAQLSARSMLGEPTVAEALIAALDDEEPLVVVSVLVALAERVESGAVDRVCELGAGGGDPLVVEEAVATLAALGDPRGLAVVLAATGGRPALRRRSVAALAAFEGPKVEAALDTLAEDRDWQVRQAVAMLRREG